MEMSVMYDLIRLSCTDEDAFIAKVRADSERIPPAIRLFLADQIRNALMGIDDVESSRVIQSALLEVGI